MEEQKINSDISYTNKDFQSIYTELLDLVKKLTNKWDPSLSNESDPGVLLLKLNALIADKNNYNIDKNVLECFPLSVTQEGNARKLYDLLGYQMKYYQSAMTDIYFQLRSTLSEGESYTLQQFTELTDTTGEIVYTTLNQVVLGPDAYNEPKSVPVIEGRIQDYEVNGVTKITISNLDSDLRLYFQDKQIAENGIFIKSVSDGDYVIDDWHRVDNLVSVPLGQQVYEFSILPDSGTCYIQFPEDIADLMGSGLEIKYILSSGSNGNIKPYTLSKFVNDITVNDVVVNDKIKILQPNNASNGANPETLSEAYTNFKRTIGTFNTLVTERDYENYLYNLDDPIKPKPLYSNVIVADRTDDLNYSYHIVTKRDINTDYKKLVVKDNKITPYDIVVYTLLSPDSIHDNDTYNSSFTRYSNLADFKNTDEFNNVKSIQHDFKDPDETGKFMFNILYPIKGWLITYYKITESEKKDIEANVKQALYDAYNSHELLFGNKLEYDDIVNTIQDADTRIKTVILDIPEIQPQLIKTSSQELMYKNTEEMNQLVARMVLSGNVQLFSFDDDFDYDFGQQSGEVIKSTPGNENITKITSELSLELTNEYKELEDNQSVQILQPNLITKTEYSSYVKYIFNDTSTTPTPISPNVDTKLGDTQSISLQYKDSNNIIQNKELRSGTIINSNIELIPNGTEIDWSTAQSLTSGNYIRERVINESTLTENIKYYFITNNISSDDEMLLNIPAKGSYILGDNEYFIYTSSNSAELIMLGTGTQLLNDSDHAFNASVPNIDLEKLTSSDINSISWQTLDVDLKVRELKITNLAKGALIKLDSGTLLLGNDPIAVASNIKYKESNKSDEQIIYVNKIGDQDTLIQSRLYINASPSRAQKLSEIEKFVFTFSDDTQSDTITNTSVLLSAPVIASGGKDLSVKVFTTSDDIGYLKAYKYTQSTTYKLKRDSKNILNLTSSDFEAGTKTCELEYNFSEQKSNETSYIIPVQVSLDESSVNEVSFSVGGTLCKLFNSDIDAQNLRAGNYTLQVPLTGGANLKIALSSDLSSTEIISIGAITLLNGYNEKEINSSDSLHSYNILDNATKVLNEITTIDNGNIFDWTYKVPSDDKVLKPVQAASYWDLNHIYNKYTLPKIDFSDNGYTLTVHESSIIKGA